MVADMNSSKEELIELVEIKSPVKQKTKQQGKGKIEHLTVKSERTYSVTSVSNTTVSEDDNIVNIFSVNPKTYSQRATSSDRRTISEISDDVFLVKPESKPSSSSHNLKRNYKEKISEHLKKIRENAINSSDLARSKLPIERVRRESEHLDHEFDNVRGKLKDRDSNQEYNGFFAYVKEEKEENKDLEENNESIFYALPEKLDFSIYLAEKECFLYVSRRRQQNDDQKIGNVEETSEDVPIICNYQRNLLEQRFCAIDDRFPNQKMSKIHTESKLLLTIPRCVDLMREVHTHYTIPNNWRRRWFDTAGNLILLENPISTMSLRPTNYFVNDPNLVRYVPSSADMQEELKELVIVKENILDVYLSNLKFQHHPLFSAENFFAEKLKSAFRQYKEMQEENTLQNLKARLVELRNKQTQEGDSTDLSNQIKRARNKYFKENKAFKEKILICLEAWKHIKKIRLHQKYSSTDVKLLIKKEKPNSTTEKEDYKKMFKESLKEILKEHEYEEVSNGDSTDENSESQSNRESGDDKISKKSKDINKIQMEKQLQKTFRSCFKTPGEPNILLVLTSSNEVTENPEFSKENSRRNVISSTKFYFRILCNSIEACKTKFLSFSKDFTLEVEEIFSLQLTDVPEFLTVEVYEQPKSLLRRKLCEIDIDVPTGKSPMQTRRSNFEKNDIVHYKHEGVGSGVDINSFAETYDLKLLNIKNCTLNTCGYLEYGLEWEKNDVEKSPNSLEDKLQDLDQIMDKKCSINYDKLNKFIQMENQKIEGHIRTEEVYVKPDSDCFRLNNQGFFSFCHVSELEENIRLKILHLRNQKEIEFDGMLVPNRLKEIPLNALSQYLRRKAGDKKELNFEGTDELKSQCYYGKKYLQQVHLKIFQLCKNTENNLDYESVVNEKYFIYFQWRPKISKPLPILSKKDSEENAQIAKTTLFLAIRVIRAKNIPNRKKHTFNEEGNNNNEVCPFVEVNYKNIFARTNTGKGTNFVWDENLVIPLESSHMDYLNPNSLEGMITVNLFDESDVEINKLNKKCMNWIGGVDILLSAISCSDNMSGFFHIKIPYVLLDYETEGEKKSQNTSTSQFSHTYLEMEIFMDPPVPKLSPNMEELPCGDLPYIQEHVLKWNKTFNTSYPHRKFNALVLDINGKSTCITRFIKPVEPPQINTEEFDVSVEQCCRYVSLIPFTVSNHFYSNIWLSTDQLISLMLGSTVDHATALTCYLTALKLDVWLLLGFGIPHGNTAYVFLPEYGDTPLPTYYIIDVVSNEKYSLMDEHCPLQRIFCVLNGKNVWANIQSTDNVALTRFDFNRHSDWLPLFDNNVPAPTNYVGKKIIYKLKEDTEALELNLEKQLKRQISKLRLLDRTIWNSALSTVLANVLKTFELNCMYNRSHHQESVMELTQEISQYTVSGFAINVHFTCFSTLVKKVKRLGIHVQEEKDTEFSLAAYIHSYPGRLLSVWIFLVNIRNND